MCTGGQVRCPPSFPDGSCADDSAPSGCNTTVVPHCSNGTAAGAPNSCAPVSKCVGVVSCSSLAEGVCKTLESCHWSDTTPLESSSRDTHHQVSSAATILGIVGVALALLVVFLGIGNCFLGHCRRCRKNRQQAPATLTPDGSLYGA
eukprot:CAMPEP_0177781456 /NCGR_PEP_ID=MMETSP0491_2-20121128/17865_1 /TAXON_ID=63592 /ORGANISM="Tetraselmis chuii, Strain PLY429" /LENGTH=146 /DNA_ID=CAMNT_0019301533 /DNA_START=452 /DNA_END=888 /DNA_ORIENTATION=+